MKIILRFFFFFFIFSCKLWASSTSPWYVIHDKQKITLHVELYLSSTCTHCQKEYAFFQSIEKNHPWLQIQYYFINEDKKALMLFNERLTEQGKDDFAVPSVFFCDSRWVGFASTKTSGNDLLQAMNYCKQSLEAKGELTPAAVTTLRHWANASQFGTNMVEKPSEWSYLLTIALVDVFNPCALFGFAGFLAFLFIETQRRKQVIAGLLFLGAAELVHYMQQNQTSSFYALVPWMRWPVALLGCSVIYWVLRRYQKQFSTRLYLMYSFLVGLALMFYQQTCLLNWSNIFSQWLHSQHFSAYKVGCYQLVYEGIYVSTMLLMLGIVLVVLHSKWLRQLKSRLISIGLVLLIGIALCFIIYPFILSYFMASVLIFLFLFVSGYLLNLS